MLSSGLLIFVFDSSGEIGVGGLVIVAVDPEDHIYSEVDGARKTEPSADGAKIIIEVAGVKDVDTANEHINVALERVDFLSNRCSIALTLLFQSFIVGC